MRIILGIACVAAIALGASAAPAPGDEPRPGVGRGVGDGALEMAVEKDVHRLVGLLDYLAADYGGAVEAGVVVSELEYEEQKVFAADALELGRELAQERHPQLVESLRVVERRILDRAPEADVAAATRAARALALDRFDVRLVPNGPPSAENGRALYVASCAVCHGETGAADTQRAKELDPPPLSFLGEKAAASLSPYRAFNVSTFGLAGTAMASFDALPARDRWDLAFHVLALRHAEPEGGVRPAGLPRLSLAEISGSTDAELEARLALVGRSVAARASDLAWLRRRAPFEAAEGEGPIASARTLLATATDRYRAGDATAARRAVLDAYLEHVEPVEARLRAVSGASVERIEEAFLRLRSAASEGAPPAAFAVRAERADRELAAAEALLAGKGGAPWFLFGGAALIVLREGIEAALLVAAMLALLRKAGQRSAVRTVHLGWIGALVAGALTWWAAQTIVGVTTAQREVVEGVVALLAAAVLAYTSYWVISRSAARRWADLLRRQVLEAIGSKGRGALFGLAFLAVYREAFETVLFFQALWSEGGAGSGLAIVSGFAAGAVVLVVAIAAIFQLSRRLPIARFFAVSGALMYALAFVFAGKGIHALVEAGVLDPRPIAFVRIDWLGVYPDALSLATQAVFVVGIALGLWIDARLQRAGAGAGSSGGAGSGGGAVGVRIPSAGTPGTPRSTA